MSAELLQKIDDIYKNVVPRIAAASTAEELEALEVGVLGRKQGEVTLLLKSLAGLSDEEKRTVGPRFQSVKQSLEQLFADKKDALSIAAITAIDITEPVLPKKVTGGLHPITKIRFELEQFFQSHGFLVLDGPELEADFYNFEALNIPQDHPARDMQDTFYIKDHPSLLMRTHTSGMQVRALLKYGAPLAAVVPGRCFRNEATDVRHEHTFYQFEGFVVGEHVTLGMLKGTLEAAARHLYGPNTQVRLRPKFYPFVEPGMNGEVTCVICSGAGCGLCKHTGWLEIFGCGMIHPNVLTAAGLDSQKVSGFAFGFGLTRVAMLAYGIGDVRLFNAGDLNFLEQSVC